MGFLRKVGCAIALTAVCAGAWVGLPRLSEPLTVVIDEALAAPVAHSWLGFPPYEADCCSDFRRGSVFALFVMLLAGIPVSIIGISLAVRARRGKIGTSDAWRSVYHGASVFQAGTAAIAGLLLVLFTWEGSVPQMSVEAPNALIFLVANVMCGALAVPAWRRIASR